MNLDIISLYSFSISESDFSQKHQNFQRLYSKVCAYIESEDIELQEKVSREESYKVHQISMPEVGEITFLYKESYDVVKYYHPDIYVDIRIGEKHLKEDELRKNMIFFLSNIFECFDGAGEKSFFLEYHSALSKIRYRKKWYELRFNFHDISELEQIFTPHRLRDDLSQLSSSILQNKQMDPKLKQSLGYILYNLFALERNISRTKKNLKQLPEKSIQPHIALSRRRLSLNLRSLEITLEQYKNIYNTFLKHSII